MAKRRLSKTSFQAAGRVTLRHTRESEEGWAGREERVEGRGTQSPDAAVPPLKLGSLSGILSPLIFNPVVFVCFLTFYFILKC